MSPDFPAPKKLRRGTRKENVVDIPIYLAQGAAAIPRVIALKHLVARWQPTTDQFPKVNLNTGRFMQDDFDLNVPVNFNKRVWHKKGSRYMQWTISTARKHTFLNRISSEQVGTKESKTCEEIVVHLLHYVPFIRASTWLQNMPL